MRHPSLALVAAAAMLALAGCTAPASNTTTGAPTVNVSTDPSAEGPHTDSGHDEDHGVPVVTWDPSTDAKVKALAREVMTNFARPEVTDRAWFNALQPHMSADYQDSAQYIDPGRITVRKILSGPVLVREKGNPMSVLAEFSTNDGPWVLSLHRSGQEEPWLITRIAPKVS